jgi:hypothetical protein
MAAIVHVAALSRDASDKSKAAAVSTDTPSKRE